jgi:RimJ/RimL family protein N-acetyltransferase
MAYLFRSPRLGFRRWRPEDVPLMAAVNSDPEVMRFFPSVVPEEKTRAFIERMEQHFGEKGFCYYAVDRLEDGGFIGFIGLLTQDYRAHFTPCVDIGWRLHRSAWGHGYATEGARHCLEQAFTERGLNDVVATAPLINQPSIRVMQKIGMTPRGTFIHPRLADDERLRECALYGMRSNDPR